METLRVKDIIESAKVLCQATPNIPKCKYLGSSPENECNCFDCVRVISREFLAKKLGITSSENSDNVEEDNA